MKRCLNCGKELVLPVDAHCYLRSNFKFKKFCNEECRVIYNNKLKKKNYILKITEHNSKLLELNKRINGKILSGNNKRNCYNPDLIKDNIDYELELFRNMHHLKNKVSKWDSSRKHILILTISNQTKDLFDEVYFLTEDKNLIKEK